MTLTDRFVVLNVPRSGSTFVRAVLRRGQHGRWGRIPESHRQLPVVSVIRHPLDHAMSHFLHHDWRRSPPAEQTGLRRRFPAWPRLSFAEYLDVEHALALPDVLGGVRPATEIGCLTAHFLRCSAADPDDALAPLTDERTDSGAIADSLPPARRLRHECLVDDLAAFLEDVGLPPRAVTVVRRRPRVNVSRDRRDRHRRDFYDPTLEALQRHRERLLVRLFPHLAA